MSKTPPARFFGMYPDAKFLHKWSEPDCPYPFNFSLSWESGGQPHYMQCTEETADGIIGYDRKPESPIRPE